MFVSFCTGAFLTNYINGKKLSFMNADSISCHKINGDDIKLLSDTNRFSGMIMYSKGSSMIEDVVPNETIAVKLALMLLESDYGEQVYEDKPYHVALLDSIWVVETSFMPLPSIEADSSKNDSEMVQEQLIFGGVGHVEINKHTGYVYTIYHTK